MRSCLAAPQNEPASTTRTKASIAPRRLMVDPLLVMDHRYGNAQRRSPSPRAPAAAIAAAAPGIGRIRATVGLLLRSTGLPDAAAGFCGTEGTWRRYSSPSTRRRYQGA